MPHSSHQERWVWLLSHYGWHPLGLWFHLVSVDLSPTQKCASITVRGDMWVWVTPETCGIEFHWGSSYSVSLTLYSLCCVLLSDFGFIVLCFLLCFTVLSRKKMGQKISENATLLGLVEKQFNDLRPRLLYSGISSIKGRYGHSVN